MTVPETVVLPITPYPNGLPSPSEEALPTVGERYPATGAEAKSDATTRSNSFEHVFVFVGVWL